MDATTWAFRKFRPDRHTPSLSDIEGEGKDRRESAFLSAARRKDRNLDDRLESARNASKCHHANTGLWFIVTREAIIKDDDFEQTSVAPEYANEPIPQSKPSRKRRRRESTPCPRPRSPPPPSPAPAPYPTEVQPQPLEPSYFQFRLHEMQYEPAASQNEAGVPSSPLNCPNGSWDSGIDGDFGSCPVDEHNPSMSFPPADNVPNLDLRSYFASNQPDLDLRTYLADNQLEFDLSHYLVDEVLS